MQLTLIVLQCLLILAGVCPLVRTGEWWVRLFDFPRFQLLLLGLMVFYALALRPFGFLAATTLFLVGGSAVLGERKWYVMIPVALIATGAVWYLVQQVLGIFLRPFPYFMGV